MIPASELIGQKIYATQNPFQPIGDRWMTRLSYCFHEALVPDEQQHLSVFPGTPLQR